MNSHLCYLYEYTRDKRIGEENSLRPVPLYEAPSPHCFTCGAPVELSKHLGGVYLFDPGTDTVHVCGPSLHQLTVRNRHEVERQCEKEAEEAKRKTTLRVGGKRVNL